MSKMWGWVINNRDVVNLFRTKWKTNLLPSKLLSAGVSFFIARNNRITNYNILEGRTNAACIKLIYIKETHTKEEIVFKPRLERGDRKK